MSSHSSERVHPTAKIHPSAHVDPSATIGANVTLEADAYVGPSCVIGEGCVLRPRAMVIRHTTLGKNNVIHPYAVLGDDPQDRSFKPEQPGELIVGDNNVFREGSTFQRSNWNGPATKIGSNGYFMVQSHAGHNAQIGDNVTMANGSCLAGHAHLGSFSVLSAFAAIHQFVRVGEGVMFQASSRVSMHVPPWVVVQHLNTVAGLNIVGLRRNPTLIPQDRVDVKRAYRALYRQRGGASMEETVTLLESQSWSPAATRFVAFFREALNDQPPRKRGVCGGRRRSRDAEAVGSDE